MSEKIAFIGDSDSILLFKVLGLEIFAVNDSTQAANILTELVEKGYAIIYITEQYAADIKETIDQYRDRKLPAIIPVPSVSGKNGMGMQKVFDSVKRAVGIDLFGFDDQKNEAGVKK
jgi:V/A-type H+/Na+-transporting ATPase subunit F